jgi:hypothetical protein
MRAFIKKLRRELETVESHISRDGPPRNPDCPHCDILVQYMIEDIKVSQPWLYNIMSVEENEFLMNR